MVVTASKVMPFVTLAVSVLEEKDSATEVARSLAWMRRAVVVSFMLKHNRQPAIPAIMETLEVSRNTAFRLRREARAAIESPNFDPREYTCEAEAIKAWRDNIHGYIGLRSR